MPFTNLSSLYCLQIALNFHLQIIGVLEKLESVIDILKEKKIGSKTLIMG
jgi:hypothetical protein